MAVVVCGVVFALTVAAVITTRHRSGVGFSSRDAVVAASTLCGGFVVAVTEGLGALGELRFGPVLACWTALGFGLAAFVLVNRSMLTGWWSRSEPLGWLDTGLIALIAAVVGASGLIAVLCPPNNYDVTLYHLPRQVQWLQQESV